MSRYSYLLVVGLVVLIVGLGDVVSAATNSGPLVSESKPVVIVGAHPGALSSYDISDLQCATPKYCVGISQPLVSMKSSVVITTNGGATWTVRMIDAQIFDLQCPTQPRCITNGHASSKHSWQTFISSDGGASWRDYGTVGADPVNLMCMSPTRCEAELLGLIGPEFGYSSDAGITWHRGGPPLATAVDPPIACPTSLWCMAAGGDVANGSAIYVTSDAGSAWHKVPSPTSGSPDQIACYALGRCVVTEDPGTGSGPSSLVSAVLRTTDGGRSWRRVGSTLLGPLAALTCSPGGPTCVDLGPRGKVYVSNDDGNNWEVINVGPTFDPTSVTCPSSSTCYAAEFDSSYQIFKTTDGGTAWREIS